MRRTVSLLAAALLAAPAGAILIGPTSSPQMDDSFGHPSTADCMCGQGCVAFGDISGMCQEDGRCRPYFPGDRPRCPRPVCLTATTEVERTDVNPKLWVAKVNVMIDYQRATVLIKIKGPRAGFVAAGFNGRRMAGTYAVVCEDENDGGRSPFERILGNHNPGSATSTSIRSVQEYDGRNRICQVIRPLVAGGSDSEQVDVFGEDFLRKMNWRLPIIAAHNANSAGLTYHGLTRSPGALRFLPCAGYTQWPTGFPSRFPSQWPSGFPSRYPWPAGGTRYPTRYPRTGFPSTGYPERTGFPTRTGFPDRMTKFPTRYPLADLATGFPSGYPTDYPTGWPSGWPTGFPRSGFPSRSPRSPMGFPLPVLSAPSKGEKAAAALQQPTGTAQKPAQEGAAAQGEKQQAA